MHPQTICMIIGQQDMSSSGPNVQTPAIILPLLPQLEAAGLDPKLCNPAQDLKRDLHI